MIDLHDDRISAWLDGELSAAEAEQVAAAVAADPALRAGVARLRAARELLRRDGPVPAPDDLHHRILDALDDEPARTGWRWQAVVLAAAAAAVLWLALPATPEAPPVAATVDEGPEAVLLGEGGAIVRAPAGWTIRGERAAIDRVLAEADVPLQDAGDGRVRLRVPAAALPALRARLDAVADLEPTGPSRPVSGTVELVLVLP